MMNEAVKRHIPLRGVYILRAVLLAAVLGCTALCAVTLSLSVRAAQEEQAAQLTREDGVTIAEEYPILSTRHISDAYLSGDHSGLTDRDRETLDMAARVLDEIIQDGMSAFEKEKAVYQWMLDNLGSDTGLLTVVPSTRQDAHEPHGVLKYRSAVCVGYATTFRLLMQMLDIPCMVIHNSEAYHSWNLVQLDGAWYHVDVYGALGTGSYYSFNVPDAMMAQEWDQGFFPAAVSLDYNPAYLAAEEVDDLYQIPRLLREALDGEKELLSLKFGPALTEDRLEAAETMLTQLQSLLSAAEPYQDILISHSGCPADDGMLLVVYLISTLVDSSAVVEGELERIDDAIGAAFGDLELTAGQPEDWESDWTDDDWMDDLFDGL